MSESVSGPMVGTGRILVVDDDELGRQHVKKVLTGAGHRVTTAASGEEALRLVAEAAPDVILLDVVMPGIDGLETCRRLKGDTRTAPIPVLMITSLNAREDRLAGIEAGANDFLVKPVDREEILLRVRNALHTKRLFDQVQDDYLQLRRLQDLRENLTHIVVHDMREPLAMVRLTLEIQRRLAEPSDGPVVQNQLESACGQVSVLVEMANALVDVSRLEAGDLTFQRTVHDPVALAGHAIDALHAMIGRRHVVLDVPHGTAPVLCHERLIVRVLVNLLVNAIRATAEDGDIRVSVKPISERVRISVTDDGPGIPPETHASLFEQFGHREGTRPGSETPSATRVGLTFSRLVAEAHGGAVGVESEIGRGATLWVEIPRDDSRGRARLAAEAGDAS